MNPRRKTKHIITRQKKDDSCRGKWVIVNVYFCHSLKCFTDSCKTWKMVAPLWQHDLGWTFVIIGHIVVLVEASKGWRWQVMVAKHSTQRKQCFHTSNTGTTHSFLFLSSMSKQSHKPKYADTKTHKPHWNPPLYLTQTHTLPMRLEYFSLWMCMHTHVCFWRTVSLMWFHLHARDPFVFIIIIRLEEADLLGLVATVMPLCQDIKNNFSRRMFVMSPVHRAGNIKREIVPSASIQLHFQ